MGIVNYNTLDDPIKTIEKDKMEDIFKIEPFYKDKYIIILFRPSNTPVYNLVPTILNDDKLIDGFGGNDLEYYIERELYKESNNKNPVLNYNYTMYELKNKWYCFYFQKIYTWKSFTYSENYIFMSIKESSIQEMIKTINGSEIIEFK